MTTTSGTSRREFLKSSAAATVAGAMAGTLLSVPAVHAAGSDTLKIGLVGCGGRGTGAAGQALAADKNTVLTAVGDAFADRLKSSLQTLKNGNPDRVKVDDAHCFVGFDAYQKVIDSGVDVVLLCAPPGFRPAHLKAAVAAGKHIFCEKPMAVDGPGYRSVVETVEESKRKNLALVAGFCWRYNNPEREIFSRVHDGAIGDLVAVYSTYNTGSLWMHPRRPEWSDMEWQMRNWLYFTWLSGDHIVEQAVHSVDKMAWAMKDQMPLKAIAHGGRQVRTDPAYGHIYDHFEVVYDFPGGTKGFLFCRQQANCASDNSDSIMGTKGTGNIVAFGSATIRGQSPWRFEGQVTNMYQVEHDELFASIRNGKPINDGTRMINSTMMAILGRMAAYTGQVITWDQAVNSKEDLTPAKLEWGDLPVAPVAMPGKTKFM